MPARKQITVAAHTRNAPIPKKKLVPPVLAPRDATRAKTPPWMEMAAGWVEGSEPGDMILDKRSGDALQTANLREPAPTGPIYHYPKEPPPYDEMAAEQQAEEEARRFARDLKKKIPAVRRANRGY